MCTVQIALFDRHSCNALQSAAVKHQLFPVAVHQHIRRRNGICFIIHQHKVISFLECQVDDAFQNAVRVFIAPQDRRRFRICTQITALHQEFLFPENTFRAAETAVQVVPEKRRRDLRLYSCRLFRGEKAIGLQTLDLCRDISLRFAEIRILEKGVDRRTTLCTGQMTLLQAEIRTFPDGRTFLVCLLECGNTQQGLSAAIR